MIVQRIMKCAICGNGMAQDRFTATVIFERGQTILVFERVPAECVMSHASWPQTLRIKL